MEAIQNLLTWSDLNSERYVISIFLDISGAFDNLAWPALQRDLANLGASDFMRALMADYLRDRTAIMTIGGVSKSVRVTKGCPQGSILGPTLWNVTMEALLRVHHPNHVFIQHMQTTLPYQWQAQTVTYKLSAQRQHFVQCKLGQMKEA